MATAAVARTRTIVIEKYESNVHGSPHAFESISTPLKNVVLLSCLTKDSIGRRSLVVSYSYQGRETSAETGWEIINLAQKVAAYFFGGSVDLFYANLGVIHLNNSSGFKIGSDCSVNMTHFYNKDILKINKDANKIVAKLHKLCGKAVEISLFYQKAIPLVKTSASDESDRRK